MKHPGQDDAA